MFMSRLANLYNVVEERITDFQKLVRHTVRHDDDITFGDLLSLPVPDTAASQFIRRGGFGVHSFAARDECGFSLQHVDDVSIFGMDFRLTRLLPTAGVDHVVATVASIEQH